MKLKTLLLIIGLTLIGSCKKTCYECKNVCYTCPALSNSLQCSTDYQSKLFFNIAIDALKQNGISCFETAETISFEECDQDKAELFNNEEYECVKN